MSSLTLGASYSIIFLSITLLTGLAGQLSHRRPSPGSVHAPSHSSTYNQHTPVLLAALAGAAIAGLGGWLASLPALRLRGLPIALLTLCLALLADNLLFPTSWIGGGPSGLPVPRPTVSGINFAGADSKPFFLLLVFVLLGVGGMVQLAAARHDRAGVGGGARESDRVRERWRAGAANDDARLRAVRGDRWSRGCILRHEPRPGDTHGLQLVFGPTFLVIVVTVGATTVEGAIGAGMAFALITQALTYLPSRVGGRARAEPRSPCSCSRLGRLPMHRIPRGLSST